MSIRTKFGNLLSLFYRTFGGYKWHILLMAFLSFLSGTLEGVGVTAIIPLFSFIGGGGGAQDSISLAIAAFFRYLHLPYTPKFLLLFMIALFFAKAIFLFFSQQITSKIMADFEKRIRSRLLALTFAARWPFLSSQKVGHLGQTLTTEVSNSSAILYYLSSAMLVFANLFIYTVLVFNLSSVIAVLTFFSALIIFFSFLPLLRTTKIIAGSMVIQNKKLAHYASENIIGAKAVKSMALEIPVLEKGDGLLLAMKSLYLKSCFLKNITSALLQLVGVFFVIGLFAFLYKTSAFEFASFAVMVYALNKVITNVQYMQNHAHVISAQIPYLSSIAYYEDEAIRNQEADIGGVPFRFEKELVLHDVDFEYRPGDLALSHVNLSIKKGEMVGLIGPSGAGKTTVVDLLLRLIEPKAGSIFIDGRDISTFSLKKWREHIGYMSQDVFLLNDTIENNIRFYAPSLSKDEMLHAAKLAHIYDFVVSQPNGFATEVGERGLSLSVGQRQRIALARVLARKPSVLILDEATSALDNESEVLIRKSIEDLRKEMTIIMIVHRLETVMKADRLFILEGGAIVEEGKPNVLLKETGSRFSALYSIGQESNKEHANREKHQK